jgi:aryl-alcohol dehydrogenase-like predicted oxidoreductase
MTELGLGTAQFGMAYGVSNAAGCVPPEGVAAILAAACEAGVRVIDTAAQYGHSEHALGAAFPARHSFRIVTKSPLIDSRACGRERAQTATRGLETSLERLGQSGVYGLLVHDVKALAGADGDALWAALDALRAQGLVQRIGVSAYTGEDIDLVLSRYAPDLVQVPVSVLDQRLIESGHLARLKAHWIEVHARSVFLQGLLVMPPGERHGYFRRFERELAAFERFRVERGFSAVRVALGFLAAVPEVDVALVGVTTPAELRECVEALTASGPAAEFATLACRAPGLLNPSLWELD